MITPDKLTVFLPGSRNSLQIDRDGDKLKATWQTGDEKIILGFGLIAKPQTDGSLILSASDALHQAPDEAHLPIDLMTIFPDNKIVFSEKIADLIAAGCFELK